MTTNRISHYEPSEPSDADLAGLFRRVEAGGRLTDHDVELFGRPIRVVPARLDADSATFPAVVRAACVDCPAEVRGPFCDAVSRWIVRHAGMGARSIDERLRAVVRERVTRLASDAPRMKSIVLDILHAFVRIVASTSPAARRAPGGLRRAFRECATERIERYLEVGPE